MASVGKVWLVGAGPGDPGLITVRAREVLRAVDVVLYDALVHPALLADCGSAELRSVGKRYGHESWRQEDITTELVALARAGRRVARLKGGDPFMFARGAEEALALHQAGVPFEVVPGVSAPVAASAYAGMSLTHRGLSASVTFITGSDRDGVDWSPDAWRRLATATDTICVFMGMRRLAEIARALQDGGRAADTPAAVVQWGARVEQRVVTATLGTIASAARDAGLSNPAIVFIGEVVTLRQQLRWYDQKPLFGKRLLVPRPDEQASDTAQRIRERAGEPVTYPIIRIVPPEDPAPLRRAIEALRRYRWVLFTSANGVIRFFQALSDAGRDARALGEARVGAIGPATADALARFSVRADLVADEFVGEGLAAAVLADHPEGPVLLPRAAVARDALPRALEAAGLEVDVVPAYRTVPVDPAQADSFRELFRQARVDVVLLTSSSTARAVADALGEEREALLAGLTVAAIGPVTARAARDVGLTVHVEAEVYTVPALLDALETHFSRG